MSSIKPTPGRVVWYYPSTNDELTTLNDQPLAAHVAAVHADGAVNLAVLDAYGTWHRRQRVALHDSFDETSGGGYAAWMPYQLGQAAKTEAVTAQHVVTGELPVATGVVAAVLVAEAVAETAPAVEAEVQEKPQAEVDTADNTDTSSSDSSGD